MDIMKCIEAACGAYPEMIPCFYTIYNDKCYIAFKREDISDNRQPTEFHSVDLKTMEVSGYISTLSLFRMPGFAEALKKGKPIKIEDKPLEHHGIKGQKWGVKNGPPYPLDQKTHDKVSDSKDASR